MRGRHAEVTYTRASTAKVPGRATFPRLNCNSYNPQKYPINATAIGVVPPSSPRLSFHPPRGARNRSRKWLALVFMARQNVPGQTHSRLGTGERDGVGDGCKEPRLSSRDQVLDFHRDRHWPFSASGLYHTYIYIHIYIRNIYVYITPVVVGITFFRQ